MAKKLALVGGSPLADPASMPPDLGPHGTAMWERVCAEFDMSDAAGWLLLEQACKAVDRAELCAEHIRRDGEIIRTPAGQKEHPLMRAELGARAFATRTLMRLGINYEPLRSTLGRPPGSS